jgi:hypothetical protein
VLLEKKRVMARRDDELLGKCIIKVLDLQQKRVSIVIAVRQAGACLLSQARLADVED